MDYTQRMPTMEEVIVKALRAHDKEDCDACPYECGYQPCRDLFREAADMIEKLERQVKTNG